MHEIDTRPCKYSLMGKICPFDDVGCKFRHDDRQDDIDIEEETYGEETDLELDVVLQPPEKKTFIAKISVGFSSSLYISPHTEGTYTCWWPISNQ